MSMAAEGKVETPVSWPAEWISALSTAQGDSPFSSANGTTWGLHWKGRLGFTVLSLVLWQSLQAIIFLYKILSVQHRESWI